MKIKRVLGWDLQELPSPPRPPIDPARPMAPLRVLAEARRQRIEGDARQLLALGELLEKPATPPASAAEPLGDEARALALLIQHPEWEVSRIAEEIGRPRTKLYKFPGFIAARKALREGRSSLPRGVKDGKTGDLEAWDEADFDSE
jgi:hypothetical protein